MEVLLRFPFQQRNRHRVEEVKSNLSSILDAEDELFFPVVWPRPGIEDRNPT